MGQMAVNAVFQAIFSAFIPAVFENTAAIIAQIIKRAIAKQAVEIDAVWHIMARKILAHMIAEKFASVFHKLCQLLSYCLAMGSILYLDNHVKMKPWTMQTIRKFPL